MRSTCQLFAEKEEGGSLEPKLTHTYILLASLGVSGTESGFLKEISFAALVWGWKVPFRTKNKARTEKRSTAFESGWKKFHGGQPCVLLLPSSHIPQRSNHHRTHGFLTSALYFSSDSWGLCLMPIKVGPCESNAGYQAVVVQWNMMRTVTKTGKLSNGVKTMERFLCNCKITLFLSYFKVSERR